MESLMRKFLEENYKEILGQIADGGYNIPIDIIDLEELSNWVENDACLYDWYMDATGQNEEEGDSED